MAIKPEEAAAILEGLHRRSAGQRKAVKLAAKKRHKGTNFAKIKTKPGYKRVKMGAKYVLVKMSPKEKLARKKTASKLRTIKR